tara:strand:- start:349 stop:2841 length:2493 start_codon:yes stop_codon:yes gene_type:complete
MAGYTRQASGNIQTGSVISATDFNAEYNQVEAAFNASTGHVHNGSTGEGARILEVGPNGDIITSATAVVPLTTDTMSLGSPSVQFKDVYIADDRAVQFGDTQDATIKYDETTSDTLLFGGANVRIGNTNNKLEFRDSALSISSSADGQLDIDADTEVEIVAPTIDLQASTAITLVSDALTIGDGAGSNNVAVVFDGTTNDGVFTWVEASDYFQFSDDVLINGTEKLYFNDAGGEHIAGDADNLTLSAGTDINLTATADVNIPSGVGLSFASDDAEKIESDGTDLTVNSGGDINLTATSDVNIPANVGVTFGDDGEKIEGNGTDLTVSSSNDITLSASNDIAVTATNDITLTAPNDVVVTNDLRLRSDSAILSFGADDDITVTHAADTGLTVTSTNALATAGPSITLTRDSVSPADDDLVGEIVFKSDSDTGTARNVGKITTQVRDVTNGTEDSDLVLSNIVAGSETAQITMSSDGVTMDNGVNIDNIRIDGTEIDLSSGDLTLDVAGDIILDADGGDVTLQDAGTTYANFNNATGELAIQSGSTPTTAVTFSGANADFAGTLDVTGATTLDSTLDVKGNVTIGDADTDTLTVTADVASNLIPSGDDTYDLGATGSEWKDIYIDGVAYVDSIAMPTTTVTDILDEDTMSSDSDTALATQQSIKAYVDTQVAAGATFGSSITFEGATADDFETTLAVTDPTADNTITLPDETGNVIIDSKAQEFTKTQNFNATTLTDAATIAWDASSNQVTSVELGGNRTFGAPTNLIDGGVYVLMVKQDSTGSRTGTWNAVFKWTAGKTPTLTTTASAKDIFTFLSDGTNLYEIGRSLNAS